jgi:hypothetical protein
MRLQAPGSHQLRAGQGVCPNLRSKEVSMNADTQDYTGQKVVDIDGTQVGEVIDFYYDAGTNEPEWLVVEAGLLDTRHVMVPLEGITRDEDRLMTPYPKDLIMDSPEVEDASLNQETEQTLYEYYHLRRELPGRTQERAPFEQDRSEIGDFRLKSWKSTRAA